MSLHYILDLLFTSKLILLFSMGGILLFKSESKDIYNVIRGLHLKYLLFFLTFYSPENLEKKKKSSISFHKNIRQHNCFQH